MRAWLVVTLGLSACSGEPAAAHGFSLTEVHQLTSSFVSGCVLRHTWADRFVEGHGRPAVVRIRGVSNTTGEDLDTRSIARTVAGELARVGRVVVAPPSKSADFMLTGRLSLESDSNPDAVRGRGHRRYLATLSVTRTINGRAVCSASGAIIRWFDG